MVRKKRNKEFLEFKDRRKIIKYLLLFFALPLLALIMGYLVLEHFISLDMTVKIKEADAIPFLPFQEGSLALYYSDKSEHQAANGESVIFKDIASKHRGKKGRLVFSSKGYETIDSVIILGSVIRLPIRRDDSLAKISGIVNNEDGQGLEGVMIEVQDMQTKTDANGKFTIDIPLEKQRKEQLLRASKTGYQVWEFAGPPSQTQDWMIILKKQ